MTATDLEADEARNRQAARHGIAPGVRRSCRGCKCQQSRNRGPEPCDHQPPMSHLYRDMPKRSLRIGRGKKCPGALCENAVHLVEKLMNLVPAQVSVSGVKET